MWKKLSQQKSLPALSLQLLRKQKQTCSTKSKCRKESRKSEPAKPAVAKEEANLLSQSLLKQKKQRLNRKAVISRLSVKPVPKSRQNDASKIKAITVTNNKTETVRKTTAVMVENKVKASAIIVVLTTKLRNSKVSKIVVMSAVSNKISSQTSWTTC